MNENKVLSELYKPKKHLSLVQRLDLGEMFLIAKSGNQQSYFDIVEAVYAYNKLGYDTGYFEGLIVTELVPLYKHKVCWKMEE
jgi:hypothetical protein